MKALPRKSFEAGKGMACVSPNIDLFLITWDERSLGTARRSWPADLPAGLTREKSFLITLTKLSNRSISRSGRTSARAKRKTERGCSLRDLAVSPGRGLKRDRYGQPLVLRCGLTAPPVLCGRIPRVIIFLIWLFPPLIYIFIAVIAFFCPKSNAQVYGRFPRIFRRGFPDPLHKDRRQRWRLLPSKTSSEPFSCFFFPRFKKKTFFFY